MHKIFPSQLENEEIYLVVREHWLKLVQKLLIWLMFALALVFFQVGVQNNIPQLLEGQSGQIVLLFTDLYLLFLLLALLLIWILYYLNIQVITSIRIVDVDQIGLFAHTVSELHIENIEDVTSETNGILGNVFNYGMVYVQTAGSAQRFEFNNVPNPGAINKILLELYENIPQGSKKQD